MKADEIRSIAVAGAGAMGAQISWVCALAGIRTKCYDVSKEQLAKAAAWADKYFQERVAKGKLTAEQVASAKAHHKFVDNLTEAAKDADVVIEAVIEKLDVKQALFKELDKICPERTILGTNSSTIVSSKLLDGVSRPDKVLNMHFFNPALVMELVEVVRNPQTSEESIQTIMDLSRRLGKAPVLVNKEISGFVVNFVLDGIIRKACYLADNGIASPQDIDTAIEKGLRHPMGPFRLLDLTGIDVSYLVRQQRYKESGKEEDKPPKIIVDKYNKGEFGRKTGKGFYDYSK